jgi:hypothetical protein
MDRAKISYRRQDNCFTWVEDFQRALTLLQEQLTTNWVQCFDPILQQIHPLLFSEMCVNYPMKYFLTCQDSEWATDLMFRNPGSTAPARSTAIAPGNREFLQSGRAALYGQEGDPAR